MFLLKNILEPSSSQHYPDNLNKRILWDEKLFYDSYAELRIEEIMFNSRLVHSYYTLNDTNSQPDVNFDDKFDYLHFVAFVQFFKNTGVNVPMCFRGTKSLKRKNSEMELIKLVNYLVKDGKRYKIMTYFTKALNTSVFNFLASTATTNKSSWKTIYLFSQHLPILQRNYCEVVLPEEYSIGYGHMLNQSFKKDISALCTNDLLFRNFRKLLPLYSLYIYKVDKNIYKNTRGKSGKFTFLWKYVARYKRSMWVMYWLYKEIKIQQTKSFSSRIEIILQNLLNNPSHLWAWKIKKFSHIYVYRNARNSLAESYITTTK